MCKTVQELIKTLNRCCYERSIKNEGDYILVCNLCGKTFLSIEYILEHLIIAHSNDIIPDVDPTI